MQSYARAPLAETARIAAELDAGALDRLLIPHPVVKVAETKWESTR